MAKTEKATVLGASESSAAGAGALGLFAAAAVFVVGILFFVAESYFLAMLLVSFAMLVYVAGAELGKLVRGSLTIFFSGTHLIENATHVQETVAALRKFLYMKRDDSGYIKVGPIEAGAKAITEFLTDQFGFSIDNLESPLRTVGNTKSAAIAFLLIDLNNLSRCHDFSSF